MKEVRKQVLEIADIAKACPENLQSTCFEVLLRHYLQSQEEAQGKPDNKSAPTAQLAETPAKVDLVDNSAGKETKQEDLKEPDIHLKARKFMEKEDVTLAQLNNLFYKEGDRILPLFDNLNTTKMSESQIRITLLQCLVSAIINGEFQTSIEAVRSECTQRKSYDVANFTSIFRNNATLFDARDIDRHTATLRLTESGKKRLGEITKDLQ